MTVKDFLAMYLPDSATQSIEIVDAEGNTSELKVYSHKLTQDTDGVDLKLLETEVKVFYNRTDMNGNLVLTIYTKYE